MKIYHSIEDFQDVAFPVLTTGTFDGVHSGHKTILKRLRAIADKNGGETVLLTFSPHPRMVLFPEQDDLRLLSTLEEKMELLQDCGVDHLIIHPFTVEFAKLDSASFIRDVLVAKLRIKKLVIGYNHHFGRNREGTLAHLQASGPVHDFEVEEIPAADIDNIAISSTKIRNALHAGDPETATAFLGHAYTLTGTVVVGDGLGKQMGYPTANLLIENKMKLIPANGVYAVYAAVPGSEHKAMMNIGVRPTLHENNGSSERKIEIHILDFERDIYGEAVRVKLVSRIRNEVKFDSTEALIRQLNEDEETSRNLLKN